MRFQGLRPEAHAPTCLPSCASKRDHFKILKHTAEKVWQKNFEGGWGQWEKQY